MRMTRRVAARAIFDEHALDALAGNVRQFLLVDEGHLGALRLRHIRENAGRTVGWRRAANRGCVAWSPYSLLHSLARRNHFNVAPRKLGSKPAACRPPRVPASVGTTVQCFRVSH